MLGLPQITLSSEPDRGARSAFRYLRKLKPSLVDAFWPRGTWCAAQSSHSRTISRLASFPRTTISWPLVGNSSQAGRGAVTSRSFGSSFPRHEKLRCGKEPEDRQRESRRDWLLSCSLGRGTARPSRVDIVTYFVQAGFHLPAAPGECGVLECAGSGAIQVEYCRL